MSDGLFLQIVSQTTKIYFTVCIDTSSCFANFSFIFIFCASLNSQFSSSSYVSTANSATLSLSPSSFSLNDLDHLEDLDSFDVVDTCDFLDAELLSF